MIAPTTLNGMEVSETLTSCDRPAAPKDRCETAQRIVAGYAGIHHDGSLRHEVAFIHCFRDAL